MTTSSIFRAEHQYFRQKLRTWLDGEIVPHINDWEAAGEIPRWVWQAMGERGYFGLTLPKAYGGQARDFLYQVVFLEEISRCYSAGFAAAISAHPILTLSHLSTMGSSDLKERYLRPGIAGEKFGALAITEPHAGSDVASIRTRAERRNGQYILAGAKTFITNGVLSDYLIVAAKTNPSAGAHGISLLVVDRESTGLEARSLRKLGWHASDTGEIHLDGVKVPANNLIGQANHGFFYIMQQFALERLVMAITAVAAADQALGYVRPCQGNGTPLRSTGMGQAQRHQFAQDEAELERARTFNYTLASAYDQGQSLIRECAMAKMLSTELSDRIHQHCLSYIGPFACLEDIPLAQMWRDSRLGPIGGGTSEIMREIIAKAEPTWSSRTFGADKITKS